MEQLPESHRKTLAPYISGDETPRGVYTDNSQTVVITDRRLISLTQGMRGQREADKIETISFAHVTGTKVETLGPEPIDYAEVGLGSVLSLLGLGLSFGGFSSVTGAGSGGSGPLSIVAFLLGLCFLGVGGYLIWKAIQTENGNISISIQTASETSNTVYRLPLSESAFAETLTETLGSASSKKSTASVSVSP